MNRPQLPYQIVRGIDLPQDVRQRRQIGQGVVVKEFQQARFAQGPRSAGDGLVQGFRFLLGSAGHVRCQARIEKPLSNGVIQELPLADIDNLQFNLVVVERWLGVVSTEEV